MSVLSVVFVTLRVSEYPTGMVELSLSRLMPFTVTSSSSSQAMKQNIAIETIRRAISSFLRLLCSLSYIWNSNKEYLFSRISVH